MGGLLEIALKYKGAILYVIIGIMFLFCVAYIKMLKTENENLELKLSIASDSVTTLQKSVDKQNESIDNLKKMADKQLTENKKTIDKAIETRKNYENKAKDMLKRQPLVDANKCVVANDYINKEIDNENK